MNTRFHLLMYNGVNNTFFKTNRKIFERLKKLEILPKEFAYKCMEDGTIVFIFHRNESFFRSVMNFAYQLLSKGARVEVFQNLFYFLLSRIIID